MNIKTLFACPIVLAGYHDLKKCGSPIRLVESIAKLNGQTNCWVDSWDLGK